ncbi:MAG: UDP-N-acetylglucosamine diphosphorylase/glucosamine-1-phosphate N-acetyltransferase [Gammaproteobacteria bacterium]|nr:UDP-N-acetylglucosamine diphosphorylase/glucosamine-1-phosphate N-acetyltransferase [Gammaproteobacteria bacterium]
MTLGVVILAAGQGTRMRSKLPKVLHSLAGRPLLDHAIQAAKRLSPVRVVVVYGHGGEQVKAALSDPDLIWVEQKEQLGTGHAVAQALPALQGVDQILVLYGDVPLIRDRTLSSLTTACMYTDLALLTAAFDNPVGYGRILRDANGKIERIVEHKDASASELEIKEINTGILIAKSEALEGWLERVDNSNSQGEFYLTDVVELAVADGVCVQSSQPEDLDEVAGVNDCAQLALLERRFQEWQADRLMRKGLSLRDPNRFDLRGSIEFGQDVTIDINVLLEGEIELGSDISIGANTVIRNCRIGDGVLIRENCVLENAVIGANCTIGPFARIRPDTELAADAHIGNFVEIKKSQVGSGSKINHLSYIGDSSIGSKVNVGAGTITCNYDGVNKHRTLIGDGAFIGSNSSLVAPAEIGAGATIGAGSTISGKTPDNTLTLTRAKQLSIKGWKRPVKKLKE